ncbi:hypothetical protein LINPERPRIM_LOCUS26216 [Linum perenne]
MSISTTISSRTSAYRVSRAGISRRSYGRIPPTSAAEEFSALTIRGFFMCVNMIRLVITTSKAHLVASSLTLS